MKKLALSYLSLLCKAWLRGRIYIRRAVLATTVLTVSTATFSSAATVDWEGLTGGTPGDGLFWSDPLNWQGDLLPVSADDVTFGAAGTGGSTVHLDANRVVNSLAFDENTTLGAYGTGLSLTNTTGNITVGTNVLAQVHARLFGTAGLNLSGGGTLHLTNPFNNWSGNISVSGAGTRLQFAYPGQATPASRSNAFPLSQQNQNITLSNGGELRLLGSGLNADGAVKQVILGTGGGALNIAAGYQQMTLDDGGQISGAGSLTKNGNGRLTITTSAYNLTGNLTVNAGLLDFGNNAATAAAVAGGQPNRFTAFTGLGNSASATNSITLNGGLLVSNNGTIGMIDAPVINFNGGAWAPQGNEHELGTRITTTTPIPAATVFNFGAGTSSTILARDAFNPAQARLPRVHGVLNGTGTLNLIGGTSNAANARPVFEHGDQTTGNYTGTIVLHDIVALESQPRYGSTTGVQGIGNTFGNANIEMRGWNNVLDLRDDATGNNLDLSSGRSNYSNSDLLLTSTVSGSLSRFVVNRVGTTTNTGNVFHLDDLSFTGNQRLVVTGGNSYGSRFNTLTLNSSAGAPLNPVLDLISAKLEVNGAIAENNAGDGIIKRGGADLNLSGATTLGSYDLKSGTTRLFGANGAIAGGNLTGAAATRLIINGGVSGNTAGTLLLDNNSANTGGSVGAANNGNRINDAIGISMFSDSTLSLVSLNNTAGAETVGNVTATGGFPTFNASQTGTSAGGTALTLSGLTLNNNAVANYTGSTLGTTAGSGKVFLTGAPVTPFGAIHGVQHVVGGGTDWAVYGANGFTNFAGYVPLTAGGGAQAHTLVNAATVTLTGGETAKTVKLAGATAATLATNGNLFAVTDTVDGGIISSGAATNVISGTAAGGITAGPAGPASLYITNANALNLSAIVTNNAGGGAVTLVKSGAGTLALVNQGVAAFPTDHTNNFTGGLVINSGTVSTQRIHYLGTGGGITLNGGTLDINAASGAAANNTAVAIPAGNLTVNGNSNLVWDNNGETAGSGFNVRWDFGSLSVYNGALFGIGGFDNDVLFNGAHMSGSPVLSIGVARGGTNENIILSGAVSGSSGFSVEAINNASHRLVLGSGATDATANTYTGSIFVGRTGGNGDPILQLDKRNGATAVTGDVTINNGSLFWGPSASLTNNSHISENSNTASVNRFQGNSLVTLIFPNMSGNDQIADTATVNLLAGTLNDSGRNVTETFATLNQRNGTFNTGTGRIEVASYNQWGGSLGFNSGGTFAAGTATFMPGAPDIGVANNFSGGQTVFEVGAGGLVLNQQNITLGNGSYTNAAGGARLILGGDVSQNFDSLNGNTVRAWQTGGSGRELAANNIIDLDGGNRTFNINSNIYQQINGLIVENGGMIKTGGGVLAVQPWNANTFSGGVTVSDGIYVARGSSAFGSGAVAVNSGGTTKLDGSWDFSNNFTISGPGSYIPGESGANGIREQGALISESGYNRLTGTVAVTGGATIASNLYAQPSTSTIVNTSVAAAAPLVRSTLHLRNAGGITGTGNLTMVANGDIIVDGGVNTSGGLTKTGNGTLTLNGAGTYTGATAVQAGTVAITNDTSLGATTAGTTVYGGATLAASGGITSAEPLTLHGAGTGGLAGALRSTNGTNTFSGSVDMNGSNVLLRADAGRLVLTGPVTGLTNTPTATGAGGTFLTGKVTTQGFQKLGSGSASLINNGNSLGSGDVTVAGGSLEIASGLSSSNTVRMSGGELVNSGAAQTTGNFDLTGAGVRIDGGSGLTFGGTFTRTAGSSADFASGTVDIGAATVGGWAVSGSDFAKKSGSIVVAMTPGDYTQIAAPAGNNVTPSISNPAENTLFDYDANGYASPSFGSISVSSLKIAGGLQGLSTGSNNITLGSGGLLATGTGTRPFNLGGSGLLSGATASDDLFIHAQRDVAISQSLIGAGTGNLVKDGGGTLSLFGASNFTGSINVGGGLLGVVGQQIAGGPLGGSVVAANRTINLNNGGGISVLTGSWDLNDYDTVTAGIQSLVINIGSGGGVLHSRDGQLLINDINGQFGGTGDLTIAGGGRVQFDQAYNFTGDTTVTGGTLRLGNSNALGGAVDQKVTFEAGTAFIAGAAFANEFVFNGTEIFPTGGDRQFMGPVTFNGTNNLVMVARDATSAAASLGISGAISGSGTINIYGNNNNGRVQFSNGTNTFTGDINLNANTSLEARLPGALGANDGDITLNLLGANSGIRVRHYLNGDYRANLNVRNNVEFQLGRHENYGAGTHQLISFNNLTVGAGTRWMNLNGDNNYWLQIKGTAAAAGNLVLNQNSNNMLLDNGIAVTGTLEKRGSSILASRGAITANRVIVSSGTLDLRGGATLTAANGVQLRGGQLMISQDVDGGANPNRYTGALTLGGGILRVQGTTNLGTVTATAGQTDVVYNSATQGNTQTPLVLTGFTRTAGSHLNFGTDFGTLGRESTLTSNARIHIPGMADTFGTGAVGSTDIIPWARLGNEFAGYRAQTELGSALGVFPVTNTFMRADAADGTGAGQLRSGTAATEIMRFTGTATTTLGGSATWRAVKMDGTATRTIDIGSANTLTIDRGAVIHVGGGDNRIGVAATGGRVQPGAGVSEFHITSNAAVLRMGAGIQNNGATAVSLVKNGAGELHFDGTTATGANAFTGNIHLNAGLLSHVSTGATSPHIPSTATIFFNGGRWEPRVDSGAANGTVNLGNNIVVNASSLSLGGDPALSLDNATAANINGTINLGFVTINNAATWSIAGWDQVDGRFVAGAGQQHSFNSGGGIAPTIELVQGRTSTTSAGESLMTFVGAMTGDAGLAISSRGNRAGSLQSDTVLVLGGGATDTAANNFGGVVEAGVTHNGSTFGALVRLNKAPGTDAIGAQGLNIGAALVRNEANEQINNAASVVINGYGSSAVTHGWNLNGRTETIGSLTQNGGFFNTGAGTLNITDAAGGSGLLSIVGGSSSNDIFQINTGGNVSAKTIEVLRYGRIVVGGGAASGLTVGSGGLTLEGTQIHFNDGAGANSLSLNGDVTTLASPSPAALTSANTGANPDKTLNLNGGVRAFNIADGSAGDDLAVNLSITNGGVYKTGDGTMVLGASALFHTNALVSATGGANTFTGDTTVSAGSLHLNKAAGVNALASTNIFVGDGSGPASLVLRNSNQIADTSDITIDTQGTLDLQTYNASESVRNLASLSGGQTLIGPNSALTVNITTDTAYAGSITGGGADTGAVIKTGSAKWTLSGISEYSGDTLVNAGTLEVDGTLNGSEITVAGGATLKGTGTVSDVVVQSAATLSPGNSPGILTTRNVTVLSGATSIFELDGATAGIGSGFHDQMNSRGSLNLDGTLVVTLSYSGVSVGDEFFIWLNDGTDSITGNFSGLPEGASIPVGGGSFTISYLANGDMGSIGNDVSLKWVPEPGTSTLALLTAAFAFSRRSRRRD